MSRFTKEQIDTLEKILGVKLPENGFVLEVRPASGDELADDELANVSGGAQTAPATAPGPAAAAAKPVKAGAAMANPVTKVLVKL